MKRVALISLLLAAPILVAAGLAETAGTTNPVITWQPATGPVDMLPAADGGEATVKGLTVHEWGTFTSVAGPDGTAIDWLPAGGPTDLPCFVSVSGAGPKGLILAEQGGRANVAKVRMETPVLYFYSPEEQSVNVKVSFPRGLMTEWYPGTATLSPNIYETHKAFPKLTATIQWLNVKVMPGATAEFPIDETPSHYYAARQTAAAPLQVGKQFEKFLFYRGVASFDPPISALATPSGGVTVTSLSGDSIPSVILFENRGGKIGYRLARGVGSSVTLARPELTATLKSLQQELEEILHAEGMYPREARAMVETWKDTWFEQGTRVFYIVPPSAVDAILPLEITPKPVSVARAFVGRMEVITAATQEEIRTAISRYDRQMMEPYGRFLEPVVKGFLSKRISPEDELAALGMIQSIRADYVQGLMACSKKKVW
jgi:hypothetical protein